MHAQLSSVARGPKFTRNTSLCPLFSCEQAAKALVRLPNLSESKLIVNAKSTEISCSCCGLIHQEAPLSNLLQFHHTFLKLLLIQTSWLVMKPSDQLASDYICKSSD